MAATCTNWPPGPGGRAARGSSCSSFADRTSDAERYDRLLALGYSVAVFWQYDVWHDVETVPAAIDHLLHHRDPRPTIHRPTPAPWDL